MIRRGGDLFVFRAAGSDSRITGTTFNPYVGFQTFTESRQRPAVQMLDPAAAGARDALSVRALLRPDWQRIVAEGLPTGCGA
ncbi:hypothetical protein BCF33_1558 [Hasllibacter halocynthiae]|uniref:Uncharacterized protein n=1 Tax=Hasllibacter halocynthiae TaxID=595589 RepID=A0A2T0X1G8_9RHOB|nr:hypothetical protein [Hasllibacter halocynthiae]PRY92704.1 hypothetical protein BCF33_1558 [Hasllibacter halocynthiae]